MSNQENSFAEAGRGAIVAINGSVLMACTVVGSVLSLYADLFRGFLPNMIGTFAVIGWIGGLAFILFLAGRQGGAIGLLSRILLGLSMARRDWTFASFIILLTAGAAFTACSKARTDHGGLLATLVETARETQAQATTAAISATSADKKASLILDDTGVIRSAVTRKDTPPEALMKKGYTTSPADLCRAALTGDNEALDLFLEVGLKSQSFIVDLSPEDKGYCLEPMLLQIGGQSRLKAVTSHFPINVKELNALYTLQTIGNDSIQINQSSLSGFIGLSQATTVRLIGIQASPLMMAVWANNLDEVDFLISQGADINNGAKIRMMSASALALWTATLSPLAEAKRLNKFELITMLTKGGAKMIVAKKSGLF